MGRTCSRPGCNAVATATFNFDGLRRVVWLAPLDDAETRSAGDLCGRHADRLRPPRHWELRDARQDGLPSTGTAAPSRYLAPQPSPLQPLPLEPAATRGPDPEPVTPLLPAPTPLRPARERVPAAARGEHSDDESSTPMLRRAFRAANVG